MRQRKKKELEQVDKNIANLERQFGDKESLGRKPEHIVDGLRQKLDQYKAQQEKLLAELA